MGSSIYLCIDLKSFYASVECVERGLDPLKTNLVVADPSRTEKTICLAVSPALKAYGIPGRARLFEVIEAVRVINEKRRKNTKNNEFSGSSYDDTELRKDKELEMAYITAPPRMALYMKYSTDIYNIYLKYVAKEDIHVYSVDEVFMDITHYLKTTGMTPHQMAITVIRDVLAATGITATAGIGTNMYLAKIAMDIVAKRMPADKDGVRIAELDEISYRQKLWDHRPLTDFWRIGRGYSEKLEKNGLYTMGDIARCSVGKKPDIYNEELLYKLFGVNAELLIDHAWGWEPCTISEVKAYRPENNSLSTGQVLQCPYDHEKGRLIIKEMADVLVLDLVEKGLITDQIVMTVGYDIENLDTAEKLKAYKGDIKTDHYGRKVPKHAHGTENLFDQTSSSKLITEAAVRLYERITDKDLLIRRIYIVANHVVGENKRRREKSFEQMDMFTDYCEKDKKYTADLIKRKKEHDLQKAILDLKRRYGKNAVIKGMNLQEGGTTISRNAQIGGHRA